MTGQEETWYALRSFNCKEMEASGYLQEQGLQCFVPMMIKEKALPDGKVERVQVPAVHNYLFMKKSIDHNALKKVVAQCPVPLYVIKSMDGQHPCEIPEAEMNEFRLLCDPDFVMATYLEQNEAEAKVGKEVVVMHGPLKGTHGKLHRVRNKYFLVKTMAGLGVMVRISRWYCKVID